MRWIRSEIEIDAPAERVWKAFTDFPSFPSWNPFIRKAKGQLAPGKRLKIQLQLGRRLVTFRPRVVLVDEPRELRWLARQWIPGLFDVDRRFVVEPLGTSRSRFVQSERATGILAPLLMPVMRGRILNGYHASNVAFKHRVENVLDAPRSASGRSWRSLRSKPRMATAATAPVDARARRRRS